MSRAGWYCAEVEGGEVVPVVLDLGALGHGEAQADEDVLELLDGLGDQVEVAGVAVGADLGEVEPLGLRPAPRWADGLELGPAGGDRGADGLAEPRS